MKYGAGTNILGKLAACGTLVPVYWTMWYFIPQNLYIFCHNIFLTFVSFHCILYSVIMFHEPTKRNFIYEVCPESIQPLWISWEPVAWPGCKLAARLKRPYCACVNGHSPMGVVKRQQDAVKLVCVPCDRRIHSDRASRSANLHQVLLQTWTFVCGNYSNY